MRQPPEVAVEEGAEVSHAVFERREPVDPDPEGKALPCVGIGPAVRDHPAVDHAAAEQLHPRMAFVVAIAADDTAPLFLLITDIDLGRGFGEGEIARAQAEHDVVALEIGLEEGFERVFEMPHMDAAIDDETFDLVKHRRVKSEEHTSELQSLMRN